MALTRRQTLLAALAGPLAGCAGPRPTRLIGAATRDGRPHIVCAELQGGVRWATPLSFRAHETLPWGDRLAVLARRPGTELVVLQQADGEPLARARTEPGRHLYGHGLWTPDGSHLLTVENDYERGRGVVVVRDATLRPVAEYASGGIGPHQLAWLTPGKTVIIANGGLLTHPEQPRKKLNRDDFVSSLVVLDVTDGSLLSTLEGPVAQASMRHLTVLDDGRVWVGYQYEGRLPRTVPLVALFEPRSNTLDHPEADALTWTRMQHYVASVAAVPGGHVALATCPRGHCVTVWDLEQMQHLRTHSIRDTAGVDWDVRGQAFALTSGRGLAGRLPLPELLQGDAPVKPHLSVYRGWQWDNHVTVI
ncbi:MAG: DUF1513 domain-containing protein [Pseudomonadota bacterium]